MKITGNMLGQEIDQYELRDECLAEELISQIGDGFLILNFTWFGFWRSWDGSCGRIFLKDDGSLSTEVFLNSGDDFFTPRSPTRPGPVLWLGQEEAVALIRDLQRTVDHFSDESHRDSFWLAQARRKIKNAEEAQAILQKIL